jgi:hypothetical protein
MKNTALIQMELGMKSQIRNGRRPPRNGRASRAAWWFARMRRAVDLALTPEPRQRAPHEQTYFPLRQTTLL